MTEGKSPAGPDFIGIGAQKAGTTWLWNVLQAHPDIWMPPLKELHYFDRSDRYPSPRFLGPDRALARWTERSRRGRRFRDRAVRAAGRAVRRRDLASGRFAWRFATGRIGDDWYRSLFPSSQRISGEITPDYSMLDAEDVRHVRAVAPRARILFLMRDPVDRAWSQLRFSWEGYQPGARLDLGAAEDYLRSPAQVLRGDYLRTLAHWEGAFGPERVLTGFYDDIGRRPLEVIAKVLRFLDVDETWSPAPAAVDRRINVSPIEPMPAHVRAVLSRIHAAQLQGLADRFGGPTVRWRDQALAASDG